MYFIFYICIYLFIIYIQYFVVFFIFVMSKIKKTVNELIHLLSFSFLLHVFLANWLFAHQSAFEELVSTRSSRKSSRKMIKRREGITKIRMCYSKINIKNTFN